MQDLFTQTKWPGIVVPTKIQRQFPQIIIGFTTKNGGVSKGAYESLNLGLHVSDKQSDVYANRELVAEQLGMPVSKWVMLEQVHGSHIACVKRTQLNTQRDIHQPLLSSCDGVYTRDKGILLVTFYADCTPLYFFSPKAGLVGLAHSGWKGTAAEIGKRMIELWVQEENVSLSDIRVAIGPSIGMCCYEVNNQVAEPIMKTVDPQCEKEILLAKTDGKCQLDLKKTIYYQMRKIGLEDSQIYRTNHCTSCLNEVYFSYRRDCGQTGRMMSFIGLREDF